MYHEKIVSFIVPAIAIMAISLFIISCGGGSSNSGDSDDTKDTSEVKYTYMGEEHIYTNSLPRQFFARDDGHGTTFHQLSLYGNSSELLIQVLDSNLTSGTIITSANNGNIELFSCPEGSVYYGDFKSFTMVITECDADGNVAGTFSGTIHDDDSGIDNKLEGTFTTQMEVQ